MFVFKIFILCIFVVLEPLEEINFNAGDKREKRSVENVTYEIEVLLVVDFSVYTL